MEEIRTFVTSDSEARADEEIQKALERPGYALDNYFYRSQVVYQRELEQILFKSWVYACHVSQIPGPGDFLTLQIANESFIIVRDKSRQIRVFANTCRHRGSRVCKEESGNTKVFVCPYHSWSYDLTGVLMGARSMGDAINKSEVRLKPVKHHLFEGLVFINADDDAADLTPQTDRLLPFVKPYHLESAKVAEARKYVIPANWKFSLENYLECYHCSTAHKSYSMAHTLKEEPEKAKPLNEAMMARTSEKTGLGEEFLEKIADQYGNAQAFGCGISHMRYALYDNFQTGTMDGKPAAPLMGDFQGYDGGAGDMQIGPLTAMLNYPDYCILYRFLPRGIDESEMELVWLVNGDAEEGKDYDVQHLTELWDITTVEDKEIITNNSRGALSRFYEPGPYSPVFEQLSMNFVDWYLKAIKS